MLENRPDVALGTREETVETDLIAHSAHSDPTAHTARKCTAHAIPGDCRDR